MNREIKFRAWDKKPKVMFAIDKEQSIAGHDFFCNDRFIPMQYIGLKDKNGKEIFEKDLLIDNVGRKWIIEYEDSEAAFVWTYITKGGKRSDYQLFNRFNKIQLPIEVIGNIYENPELLK